MSRLHVVVVGNPESNRVAFFQAALARLNLPPATIVSYLDLLAGRDTLERVVRPGTVVRIESPGRNFEVDKALLAAGAGVPDEEGPSRIGREEALRLPYAKGRILYPRQWYLGFRRTLRRMRRQLARCSSHFMNPPGDIEVMFDKRLCQERFAQRGIPIPANLGPVRSYEELRRRMDETGHNRVFIKLAHGSSASGVVAYARSGPRQQALTTVQAVRRGGELRLYNSRTVRCYRRDEEIADLIDALAREGVQVEEWVPKAGLQDQVFDLRVVAVGGQARHVVVRMGQGPMTNLHLLNRRGDLPAVVARMGPESWAAALRTCEAAAAVFPRCRYAGVDLLVAAGYRRHAVAEINAFGDLLPGITCDGQDTYEAEIRSLLSV